MSQIKILIIDDEINIAKTIAAVFSDASYAVEVCNDGLSGWNRLSQEKWDIVFLDIRMPEMDGMEVLKKLYDSGKQQNIVMITAYGSIENAVQAMKYGAIDFIMKPLDLGVIRQLVSDILSRPLLLQRDLSNYKEHLEHAKLMIQKREYAAAKSSVKKALKEVPESAEAYNLLGALYEVMDDLGSAVQAYQMALRFDNNYKPAQENISRVTSLEGNTASLIDLMRSLKKD